MSETAPPPAPALAPAPIPAPIAPPAAPPLAFADTLPEDIRAEAAFKDIKDLGGLAKSYLNATRMIGGGPDSLVKLPTAPDAPEWDSVYAKLGRPEAPDKYGLKIGEGVQVDPKMQTGFQTAAHKAGLNPRQAQGLMDWYNGEATAAIAASTEARAAAQTATITALKTEWGAAFDQNLTLAKNALDHFGGDKLAQELDANGLGNSPELARVFAKLGAGLREDGVIGRGAPADGGIASPTEAKQQLNALEASAEFKAAALDKRNPARADLLAKRTRLYEMAYPPGQP